MILAHVGFVARLWLHTFSPRFAAHLYIRLCVYKEFQEVFWVSGQARRSLLFFGAFMHFNLFGFHLTK